MHRSRCCSTLPKSWGDVMNVPKPVVAAFVVNLLLVAARLFALRQNVKLRSAINYDPGATHAAKRHRRAAPGRL